MSEEITSQDDQSSIEKSWYVVHTYSGYEHRVKTNLESRAKQVAGMSDEIFRIMVPEQEVTTIQDGEKKTAVENDFPGYVLVEMATPLDGNMSDDAWFIVRNTPGVTGFLGSHGAKSKPTSLLPEEVDDLMRRMGETTKEAVTELDVQIGQSVTIATGLLAGSVGPVIAIDHDKHIVTVNVEVFGRETPTEVSFNDVNVIDN